MPCFIHAARYAVRPVTYRVSGGMCFKRGDNICVILYSKHSSLDKTAHNRAALSRF